MYHATKLVSLALFSAVMVLGWAENAYATTKVYTISELEVVRQAAPEYPRAAARSGFDGWVDLEFTVTPTGDVSDVEVLDSSSRVFHREALVAMQNWQFKPVMNGGAPAPVRAQLRFTFQYQ